MPSLRLSVLTRALVTAAAAVGVTALASGTASAATPPSVSITSPTAGATVKGTIAVAATATAASGDYITSITFYDGVDEIDSQQCQQQQSCSVSVEWEATGLTGQHSLTAVAHTESGASATSAAVVVTVLTPPPSVSITSPAAGTTVEGDVTINVSAATDPALSDYPTSIDVYDGVSEINSIDCQQQQTCQGSITWEATGLSGAHALTATVHTEDEATASASITVTVVSPGPTVAITSPRSGARLGGNLRIHVSGKTNPTQVDYPTSITVYDGSNEIGSVGCQGQQTCAGTVDWNSHGLHGKHVLRAVIETNRGLQATSRGVVVGVAVRRDVAGECRLSTASAASRQRVRGSCVIRGLPKGTRVTVQVRTGNRWLTVVAGRSGKGGSFKFKLRGTRPGTFDLYLSVAATRATNAARIHIGVLQVT